MFASGLFKKKSKFKILCFHQSVGQLFKNGLIFLGENLISNIVVVYLFLCTINVNNYIPLFGEKYVVALQFYETKPFEKDSNIVIRKQAIDDILALVLLMPASKNHHQPHVHRSRVLKKKSRTEKTCENGLSCTRSALHVSHFTEKLSLFTLWWLAGRLFFCCSSFSV